MAAHFAKQNMEGGFAYSPIRINKEVANKEHWTEQDILDRAKILSEQVTKVWLAPVVERSILKADGRRIKKLSNF